MKTKAKGISPSRRASKVSLSMVGFFDVLGFSNRVESVESEAELLKIAKTVESIRNRFEYQSKDKNIRDLHNMLDKRVLAFSDCGVTAVSAQTDFVRQEGIFDTFGSQIVDMAYSQIQCIEDGYFLRGGVDIGYWYYDKGLLVSPALVAAYKEERDRACYPVISISRNLYKLLKDEPGRKFYSKDADPLPDEISSLRHPKGGMVHFINYLRITAKSLDWQYDRATYDAYMAVPRDSDERSRIMGEGYYRSLVDFFRRHKELIATAHKSASESVKVKYRFLANYHNKEVRNFLPKQRELRIDF